MDFKTKSEEVKAAGERARGNFKAEGAPLKVYNYWLHRSGSKGAREVRNGEKRENFCHFWRVVAIWAPLLFLGNKFTDFAESWFGMATLATVVIGAIVWLSLIYSSFATGVGVVALIAYGLAGLVSGFGAGLAVWEPDALTRGDKRLAYIGSVITLPAALATFLVFSVIAAAYVGYQRSMLKPWMERNDTNVALTIGAALVVFLGSLAFIDGGFVGLSIFFGVLLGIPAVLFLVAWSADAISTRRELAHDRAEARQEAGIVSEPREPGILVRFFTGLADFLILAAQVVRVNKWKICPLVDVDTAKKV